MYINRLATIATIAFCCSISAPLTLSLIHILRDMTKNTIYAFSHSAAMNGLSEDSRIVSITPWWSITLKVLIAVFAIMTIAFIGLYVRGEVKRSSDAGKEEKK